MKTYYLAFIIGFMARSCEPRDGYAQWSVGWFLVLGMYALIYALGKLFVKRVEKK